MTAPSRQRYRRDRSRAKKAYTRAYHCALSVLSTTGNAHIRANALNGLSTALGAFISSPADDDQQAHPGDDQCSMLEALADAEQARATCASRPPASGLLEQAAGAILDRIASSHTPLCRSLAYADFAHALLTHRVFSEVVGGTARTLAAQASKEGHPARGDV